MPISEQAIINAARKKAMDALERGVRAGAWYLTELLKATVSHGGAVPMQGPQGRGTVSPFLYRRKGSKSRGRWEKNPPEWGTAARFRDMPPLSRSGEGARSIGYQIIERDDAGGKIRVLIGGDSPENQTRGGFHTLPGYMTGHEFGIRYPTRGPHKGSGPVIQRPWLRSTIQRYWGSFVSVITHVASEA